MLCKLQSNKTTIVYYWKVTKNLLNPKLYVSSVGLNFNQNNFDFTLFFAHNLVVFYIIS